MADSETPVPEGGEAKQEALLPPSPKSPANFLKRALPLFGVFGLALAGSQFYLASMEEPPSAANEPPKNSLRKIDTAGSPVEHLAQGDAALERHLYSKALSNYEELLGVQAEAAPAVAYRVGLCNESLGQMALAIAAYRNAVPSAQNSSLTVAAHLGMARCLLRQNQTADARRLLYPLLLNETAHPKVPPSFMADARYIVALTLARDLMKDGQKVGSATTEKSEELASVSPAVLDIPFYLEEAGPAEKSSKTATTANTASSRRSIVNGPQILSATFRGSKRALEVLTEVGSQCHLKVTFSALARKALTDQVLDIAVTDEPALQLIRQIADYNDLICIAKDEAIHLVQPAELDSKEEIQARRQFAAEALCSALRASGSHSWAPAIRLELGNLDAAQDRLKSAVQWYRTLIGDRTDSRCFGAASYNLAALRLRERNFAAARSAFIRVIDNAPGDDLAIRARLHLGQIYLEDDNIPQAVMQLRRADVVAPGSRHQPLVALYLACAHLRDGRPDLTRLVLAKARNRLQRGTFKSSASFLECYAQYQIAKKDGAGRQEAGILLHSLSQHRDAALLGVVGGCLVAQAYADLGLWDQTEKVVRQASLQAGSPMEAWANYLLADALLQQNREQESVVLWQKLAQIPSSYSGAARVRLARLDLEHRRFQDAISKCSQLWSDNVLSDPSEMLHVWGSALEGAGEFEKAAQCFAGKAPQ